MRGMTEGCSPATRFTANRIRPPLEGRCHVQHDGGVQPRITVHKGENP